MVCRVEDAGQGVYAKGPAGFLAWPFFVVVSGFAQAWTRPPAFCCLAPLSWGLSHCSCSGWGAVKGQRGKE